MPGRPCARSTGRVPIIDGILVLGEFFSVAEVEGAGAQRPDLRSTAAPCPGVHVDGAEAWLYPIEVPRYG